jgi:hypothetical protein
MARGWESKSVEAQQDEVSSGASQPQNRKLTPEELQRDRKKTELLLSRSRVTQQLEAAGNPRYSQMLHTALAELDRQIAELND